MCQIIQISSTAMYREKRGRFVSRSGRNPEIPSILCHRWLIYLLICLCFLFFFPLACSDTEHLPESEPPPARHRHSPDGHRHHRHGPGSLLQVSTTANQMRGRLPIPEGSQNMLSLSACGQEEDHVPEDRGPVQDLRELERLDQVHDAGDHAQGNCHVGAKTQPLKPSLTLCRSQTFRSKFQISQLDALNR